MHGKTSYQVYQVFETIKHIGSSRHIAKDQARQAGAKNSSEIADKTGIYSYRTADAYRDVARDCMNFIKETYGISNSKFDIEKITSEQVAGFLQSKVDEGKSYTTIKTYAAALGKLETALNKYAEENNTGNTYSFKSDLASIKSTVEKTEVESRAFKHPEKVIEKLQNAKSQIVADLQYSYGLRFDEAAHIKESQLEGNILTIQGKGGYELQKTLTDKQVANIRDFSENGVFQLGKDSYLRDIENSCNKVGEIYTGSHAFRHSYAQERFTELREAGVGEISAKLTVSQELGHHRIDIVNVYLR